MKKYDVLKTVVIIQALGMVALSVFVMWSLFPNSLTRSNNTEQTTNEQDGDNEVVAEIADYQITKTDLLGELLEQYGDQALEQMLTHQAIRMASKEQGISLTSEEVEAAIVQSANGYESVEQYFKVMKETLGISQDKMIQEIEDQALLIKMVVQQSNFNDDQIHAYLKENEALLQPVIKFDIRWILTNDLKEAEEIMTKLSDGEPFVDLAKKYSIDIYSAEQGGVLGEIEADDPFYDPAMLTEAAQLKIGDISGPIEVTEGYAIIQLMGRQAEQIKTAQEQYQWAKTQLALKQIGSIETLKQDLLNKYVTVIRK